MEQLLTNNVGNFANDTVENFTNDVEIRSVSKVYGSNTILNGINLDVRQGELLTLLGPSGCGKTTILNVIAGFTEISSGDVYIKEKKMNNIPPYKRDLGMVFQAYSLFPHMTVFENLNFGLNLQRIKSEEKNRRIKEALNLVKMNGLEERYPRELSGGQRQRVAIARALVVQPTLLLLDEPLSNLDAKLRHELRSEIKRLQKEVGVTTIFVTHDQEEALSISDRIVVMNGGKIEQIGTPKEIYDHPKTHFVFQFIGKSNCLSGKIQQMDRQTMTVRIDNTLEVTINQSNILTQDESINLHDDVDLYIRPEKLSIFSYGKPLKVDNFLPAQIVQMNYLGTTWEIEVLMGDKLLQVLSTNIESNWINGSEVMIGWNSENMMIVKK